MAVATIDARPVQIIVSTLHRTLTVEDPWVLPETEAEIAVQRLAKGEALQPFDLSKIAGVHVSDRALHGLPCVTLTCSMHLHQITPRKRYQVASKNACVRKQATVNQDTYMPQVTHCKPPAV